MNRMSTAEMGWLAGIIEGEGWFVTNKKAGPQICVAMTDFDVVQRLHSVTGAGRLNEKRPSRAGAKIQLQWTVSHRDDVERLGHTILPYLGERRSLQLLKLLAMVEDLASKAEHRKNFFACGHPATPENTYVIGRDSRPGPSRACRMCAAKKSVVRQKQKSALRQASRTDICAWMGCGNSLAGRHMNAKFCSEECAFSATLERRRLRRRAVRA